MSNSLFCSGSQGYARVEIFVSLWFDEILYVILVQCIGGVKNVLKPNNCKLRMNPELMFKVFNCSLIFIDKVITDSYS